MIGTPVNVIAYSPWTLAASGSIGATVTQVKGSAGILGGYYVGNSNSSAVYFEFFDAATPGAVTPGSTAPLLSLFVPAGGAANLNLGAGLQFFTGIMVAATTLRNGTIAPANTVDYNVWGV